MPTVIREKQSRLIKALKIFDRLAVALSGGVDSALLLAEAHAVLGNRLMAVTARSAIHSEAEVTDAVRIAASLGVPHVIVDSDEIHRSDFLANTPERCYICKKNMFKQLLAVVREKGIRHLAHGANADDPSDYRPGLRAAGELGVVAPLMDAGFTKADIRHVARGRGLTVWNKPAMACLATRIPYGDPIDAFKLEQVRSAEQMLALVGLVGSRVRHHGDVARIEVPLDQLSMLFVDPLRQRIVDRFRNIGFFHIAVDLEGYVSGSMNRSLDENHDRRRPNG